MENYITEDTLKQLNIALEGHDVVSLLTHLNEELEKRVGTEMTDALDEPQLQELVQLQETASDEELNQWLRAHVTDFEQIISDEADILLGELADNADTINRAA